MLAILKIQTCEPLQGDGYVCYKFFPDPFKLGVAYCTNFTLQGAKC